MQAPSPLTIDFDEDTPFGLLAEGPYQPLGASLDNFFLGGNATAHNSENQHPLSDSTTGMDIEQPTFLHSARAGQGTVVLNELETAAEAQEEHLQKMYAKARSPFPDASACAGLRGDFASSVTVVVRQQDTVLELLRNVGLFDQEVHRAFRLLEVLRIQLLRLRLAHIELGQRLSDPVALREAPVALTILRQPFPCVFTKGKSVEEGDLQVRLLCGPSTVCKVKGNAADATLNMDPSVEAKAKTTKKGGGGESLSNARASLNNKELIATFLPKFELGSRKTAVTMHFTCEVDLGPAGKVTVRSEVTKETIIITNESQWEGSEGILLRNSIFSGVKEVPWVYFANLLQHHFLIVTRQDPEQPSRSLSRSDLTFLANNFFRNKQVIDVKTFELFWEWYGKCLQALRYQRHIGSLWNSGLLLGFVSREDVDNALRGRDPGVFLLRFSERHAGQFAVAYVGYEMPRRVKHYLVQPTDTASAKKTLPDFLSECHQFQKVLEIEASGEGGYRMHERHKDDAFSSFFSKVDRIDPGAGYDQLVPGGGPAAM